MPSNIWWHTTIYYRIQIYKVRASRWPHFKMAATYIPVSVVKLKQNKHGTRWYTLKAVTPQIMRMSYLSVCDLPLLITSPESQNIFYQTSYMVSFDLVSIWTIATWGGIKLILRLVGTNLACCQCYLMYLMSTLNVHGVTLSLCIKNMMLRHPLHRGLATMASWQSCSQWEAFQGYAVDPDGTKQGLEPFNIQFLKTVQLPHSDILERLKGHTG